MALARANNDAVTALTIELPRSGCWVAEVVVDAPDLTGAVTLTIDDRLTFKGTVSRGGGFLETSTLLILPGAGRIGEPAKPRHYGQVSVRSVLGDLLRDVGETLSPTADASLLGRQLEAWTTVGQPTGRVVGLLLAEADPAAVWRFLPDGTLWVGFETWPDSGLAETDYQIVDEMPALGAAVLAVEAIPPMPGTTLAGRKISSVDYRLTPQVRATLHFEAAAIPVRDRLSEAFSRAVRGAVPEIDHSALYWARIVKQDGAFVDVEPEDNRVKRALADAGGIPMVIGYHGSSTGTTGARVLIGWSGGNPSRPFAIGFEQGNSAQKAVWDCLALFLGGEALAEPTLKGTTYRAAETTKHTAMGTALGSLVAASTGPLAALEPGFAALAAAITAFEAAAATFPTTNVKVK